MRILVTGGSGFIGTHTVRLLLSEGHFVRILDLNRASFLHENLEYLEGDILSKSDCMKATADMDWVLHLAAYSRSGPSTAMWQECLSTNIVGTINILDASHQFGVKRFVYAGSSTYYGNLTGMQCVGDPPDFLNFYGISKYTGEEITNQFSKYFQLPTINLRYFNVYGPGQPVDGAYGLVMGIFAKACKDKLGVEIHGTGEQRRDFIHVVDVARANLAALQTHQSAKTYNIGSGNNISINDLAKYFNLKTIHVTSRIGDAAETLADIATTRLELDWEPTISLRSGIADLINQESLF